jgi:predicted ABC-type ATPase
VDAKPLVIVLGGPNGAGKSTAASAILPPALPFLNADEIAKGLPGYPSPAADLEAGRQVLQRMEEIEKRRDSVAVETTLAGRSLAHRLTRLRSVGYLVRLIDVWTPSAEFSVARVAERVRMGGHSIPEPTIRRRYHSSLINLFDLYLALADLWDIYENATLEAYRLIARGGAGQNPEIIDPVKWSRMQELARHERPGHPGA